MEDKTYEFKIIVTYIRYYNDQTNWGVIGFKTLDFIDFFDTPNANEMPILFDNKNSDKKQEEYKFSTLAGKMQELTIGGEYLVKATYKYDKTYGHQYVPISIYALIPQTKESQLLFLQSIVPINIAENLIDAYPNIVNDVANGTLETIDYSKVKGVRETTWLKVKEKIIANYLISDIITMLKPLGVTYSMIKKLLSEEKNPSLLKKELEENPWMTTKISGIGFKKADELALRMKPNMVNSVERLIAFMFYFLREHGENDGHTWISKDLFKQAIKDNVPECMDNFKWVVNHNDFLHIENDVVGLKYYRNIEYKIFDILIKKSKDELYFTIDEKYIKEGIEKAEQEQGFKYTTEQIEVIRNVINSNIAFITGSAGTGKTSISRAIINIYKFAQKSITASALSAMAAQRITEATDFPAMTIHRTLGCQGFNEFLFNKDNPMITNVVFLDEGSMVNAKLFLDYLYAIDINTKIIISGDHKQLPPIGFGNAFSDLIEVLPNNVVFKLNKVLRQAQDSGIIVDANKIRDNINPITEQLSPKIVHGKLNDMYYMFRTNRESLFNIAIKTYFKSIETDGIDNVVIAVPRKDNCLNSTKEINNVIQDKLLGDVKEKIVGYEGIFKLGAKVVQIVNDYDKNVFNGEIGYITNINNNKKKPSCEVTFNGNKIVSYTVNELKTLELAYAMTTHKLQGSGKKTVICIIDNTHYKLLDNCMLYTMITRAKKRCLLLAEPQALLTCIRTSHNKRNTWLSLKK